MPLPPRLDTLLITGAWPRDAEEVNAQNLRPRFSVARVRQIALGETEIYLFAPPFRTVAERIAGGEAEFWQRFGALEQIDPTQVVIIGDFGLGSDAPIALDHAARPDEPRVIRLRWGPAGTSWESCAESFDAFADALGL